MHLTSKPKESTIDGYENLTPLSSPRVGREALVSNEIDRGGNLLSNMNSVLLPTPGNIFDRGARRVDNNRLWTIMQTLNFMIGSGILNTAQIFMESGVVAATVMYIIAGGFEAAHLSPCAGLFGRDCTKCLRTIYTLRRFQLALPVSIAD